MPICCQKLASDIARHHHERWDGNGYPEGISGSAIPLPARLVCLCDSYDALTHEKAYRRAFSSDEAISEILRLRELQFDPRLVERLRPRQPPDFVRGPCGVDGSKLRPQVRDDRKRRGPP